ncbi:response regulator [Flavobacterium sp. 5]|uniref:response regulator n=1 Tax=Flavobacterium sp. 5 TaxID=2035199 RepID=UPI000C2CBB98|nr:response regulator [Flavobacterium sp. 5]PKB18883.1 response regulator receiver domain-containing protein [Flavobacterium sp. 5]
MKHMTIWVIDDDPIYQIIVNKMIKKSELFLNVLSFKNGKEAIDDFKKKLEEKETLPNIILLDINMPVMDGWEFMAEMVVLKEQINETIQIYIVSSSIAVEDKNKAKHYPEIVAYLVKPINNNDLTLITANY